MKIGSGLSYARLIESLARMEIEKVELFIENSKAQFQKKNIEIDQAFSSISRSQFLSDFDFNSYVDTFADEAYMLKEVLNLSEQLAVVALYRIVEIRTTTALSMFGNKAKQKKRIFKSNEITNVLKSDFGIKMSLLKHYNVIDELRLINNTIKHSGEVSKQLYKYGWNQNDKLEISSTKLENFINKIPEYIYDFVDKLSIASSSLVKLKPNK